jgi:16S rRNA (cytosine1402-N4)-methyltransferase
VRVAGCLFFFALTTLATILASCKVVSNGEWLATANETEIANVIYQFGEERKSRHIASAIKRFQENTPLETTLQLANIVASVFCTSNKFP